MAEHLQFSKGDVVVHTRRPEWGDGKVDEVVNIQHEGKAAQRLIVKFANQGRVTLNSAIAPLVSKDAAVAMITTNHRTFSPAAAAATPPAAGKDWLSAFEKTEHELHRLPDSLSDPFQGTIARIESTLETYRYSTEARSLIEWAIAQTGLNDPMTKYTRHELEQGFERYARDRDLHLKDLVRQMKQQGRLNEVDALRRQLKLPAAVSALDRAKNSI